MNPLAKVRFDNLIFRAGPKGLAAVTNIELGKLLRCPPPEAKKIRLAYQKKLAGAVKITNSVAYNRVDVKGK